LVLASGLQPVYLATAEALDGEMEDRVRQHRARRGTGWLTVEEPLDLPEILAGLARPNRAVLVDCLTLWVTNLLLAERSVAEAGDRLLAVLDRQQGSTVLVSNEVGQGVVPMGELSRAFVDEAGRLHQKLAARADCVRLIVAGLALDLKSAAAGR
jgi:adenosylcobinamide kinase/adenosylcobinamide-phosphate guanylyltransferase